ncbi:hypothetical protein K0M31_020101 [Melipona bicolor]|uniref:Uncharacterized protein n=1 Tax=Melipona bicolor TaxID=60889 RepID=A0AA40KQN1_9HYME|nr:hypothetical protein K0M31_020101 [Melipona bicolor]
MGARRFFRYDRNLAEAEQPPWSSRPVGRASTPNDFFSLDVDVPFVGFELALSPNPASPILLHSRGLTFPFRAIRSPVVAQTNRAFFGAASIFDARVPSFEVNEEERRNAARRRESVTRSTKTNPS